MSSRTGYVKLYRSATARDLGNITTLGLFAELLFRANRWMTIIRQNGNRVALPVGAMPFGYRSLAEECGVTVKTLRRHLQLLIERGTIVVTASREGSILQIVNYETYQGLVKTGITPSNPPMKNKEKEKTKKEVLAVGVQSGPARVAPRSKAQPKAASAVSVAPSPGSVYDPMLHNISETPCVTPVDDSPRSELSDNSVCSVEKSDNVRQCGSETGWHPPLDPTAIVPEKPKLPAAIRDELNNLYSRLPNKPELWKSTDVDWSNRSTWGRKKPDEKTACGYEGDRGRNRRLKQGPVVVSLSQSHSFGSTHTAGTPGAAEALVATLAHIRGQGVRAVAL